MAAYQKCLAQGGPTIVPRQDPPAPTPTLLTKPSLTGADRYMYCKVHQDRVIAASQQLVAVQGPWVRAMKVGDPNSIEFLDAKRNLESAQAELEKILPPEIRHGQAMVPDAIKTFSTCNPEDFE